MLPAPDAAPGDGAAALALTDIDGDGHGDLVVAGKANGVAVLEQQFTAATTPSSRALMFASTSPAPYATGVATSAHPGVTFAATPDAASVTTGNLYLVDGRTGAKVAGTVALSGDAITFSPSAPLVGGVPYRIVVHSVALANGRNSANGEFPFVTAEGSAPTYAVDEDYSPLVLDLDGNGYDDLFWYGPGTAPDAIWRMGPNGPTTVASNRASTRYSARCDSRMRQLVAPKAGTPADHRAR